MSKVTITRSNPNLVHQYAGYNDSYWYSGVYRMVFGIDGYTGTTYCGYIQIPSLKSFFSSSSSIYGILNANMMQYLDIKLYIDDTSRPGCCTCRYNQGSLLSPKNSANATKLEIQVYKDTITENNNITDKYSDAEGGKVTADQVVWFRIPLKDINKLDITKPLYLYFFGEKDYPDGSSKSASLWHTTNSTKGQIDLIYQSEVSTDFISNNIEFATAPGSKTYTIGINFLSDGTNNDGLPNNIKSKQDRNGKQSKVQKWLWQNKQITNDTKVEYNMTKLKADWSDYKITLKYKNGATDQVAIEYQTKGNSTTIGENLLDNIPPEGKEFMGWSTKQNSSAIAIGKNGTYKTAKDITLYAVYQDIPETCWIKTAEGWKKGKVFVKIDESSWVMGDVNVKTATSTWKEGTTSNE